MKKMTVPVHHGATKIDKFFNSDEIIKISKESDLEEILKQCTKGYEQRQKTVIDNYYRSLLFSNINDLLYETVFLDKGIKLKKGKQYV